jgi:hypothetical protein
MVQSSRVVEDGVPIVFKAGSKIDSNRRQAM